MCSVLTIRLISNALHFMYRHPTYSPIPESRSYLVPSLIHLPLSISPLSHLLATTKELLTNNFMSLFATIAGSIILFHYETTGWVPTGIMLQSLQWNRYNLYHCGFIIRNSQAKQLLCVWLCLYNYGVLQENGNWEDLRLIHSKAVLYDHITPR